MVKCWRDNGFDSHLRGSASRERQTLMLSPNWLLWRQSVQMQAHISRYLCKYATVHYSLIKTFPWPIENNIPLLFCWCNHCTFRLWQEVRQHLHYTLMRWYAADAACHAVSNLQAATLFWIKQILETSVQQKVEQVALTHSQQFNDWKCRENCFTIISRIGDENI